MPHPPRIAASLPLLLMLAACASLRSPPPVTFVVVRHAEKSTADPGDPALTAAGMARAQRLASTMATAPLVAVYATATRRTQQTAAPVAAAHGLTVATYDAKAAAADIAAMLRQAHRSGHVLVVAHSNTAPDIAAALCGCAVEPMDETEYGRQMTIQIPARGPATLISAATP